MDGGHPYRNRKRIERTERAGGEPLFIGSPIAEKG